MRINELIVEQQIDEGLGQAIGKAWGGLAKGAGAVAGGLAGTWDAAKQGYAAGKAAVTGKDDSGTAPASSGGTAPTPAAGGAPATGGTTPAAAGSTSAPTQATGGAPAAGGTAPAPAASSSELDQLKATLGKLNPDQKKELAGELEKSMNAPAQGQPAEPVSPHTAAEREAHKAAGGKFDPQTGQMIPLAKPAAGGNTATIDPAQAQADRAAKNAADAAERDKQIAATKQANAATAQADNQLVAAVKAAKAKPAFQQTAQDKLTIKQGAEKGIHESKKKKKKLVAEFNSKFLGMKI